MSVFTCKKCCVEKHVNDFYSHPKMKLGHLSSCKECVKARVNTYRAENIDRARAYDRKRGMLPERKKAVRDNAYKYKYDIMKVKAKHPEHYKARDAVNNALRRGILKRPQKCERCGVATKLHGHHEDYSKPLDVNWLCYCCHGERHRELNEVRRQTNGE